jgi:hypothetical protein
MKIGSGWTKTTNDGDTFISVSLDETLEVLYPQLKDCFITLWHVKQEDRKSETSPSWTVSLSVKKEQATTQTDEIPF